jgi:hypothetical protein
LCVKELAAGRRIPIFLELRRYDPSQSFKVFLINAITAYRITCDEELFDHLADSGKLVLLLDAFDEVEPDAVTRVVSEVELLAQRFPQLQIVVTSRPDSGIQLSPHFRVYHLAPLTAGDQKPFLEKIVDDKKKVKEILTAIQKSRAEIVSLLQTPLLLTLLVIIYNSTQEIPASLSEFYEALFQILLTRHDKTKPGFRRKRATQLSDPELRKLFEAFCYATRQRDQLVLTESAAGGLLGRACEITGLNCKTEDFLNDITKVACLMQQEGFDYHFIHKSVVEFHAASFIGHASDDNARKFYAGVSGGKWQKWRQELEFLSQIARPRYLRHFYVPSSLNAMREFAIDANVDSEISDDQLYQILNHVKVMAVAQNQMPGVFPMQFHLGNVQEFITNSVMMTMIHHVIRLLPGGLMLSAPLQPALGLGDFFAQSGEPADCLEAVRHALQSARLALKQAQAELAMEARVGDFVAP